MSDINLEEIGNTLKNHRLKQNLSIRDVSTKSKIAASTISQIETGKTSPNLLTLKAICDALNVPVFSLFLEEENENIRLVKKNEQQTFVRNISNGKNLVESLITQGNNEMWAAIVDVPAKTDSGNYARHGGEEFVFVLKGSIIYDLEKREPYMLNEYDTLYYPNHIGHRWVNISDQGAQILLVSTSPYKF